MIEFPITLTSGGSVCLPGHAFALALGYTKNRGVYCLRVDATGEWEGLTIRAFWHVPDGKDPASSLVVDGSVIVPALVTAKPGTGCITFEGTDGGKLIASADVLYRVGSNSGTTAGTTPDPEPGAWQQFVDAVKSDAAAAQQAAQAASSSAAEATRQAGLAAQAAEGKGYMYLEDHDNSGTLSLVIADSITDEITLRDNGAGVLEVVYQ